MRRSVVLVALTALCAFGVLAGTEAFNRLDSLIAAQPRIIAEKESRLSLMKADLDRMSKPGERFAILHRLYEEYAAYQYDSAYSYVSECLRLAESMGNQHQLNESRLDLAHILSTACLMDKAQSTLDQIDMSSLDSDQLIRYYRTQTDLLIYQAEYMQGTQYAAEYVQRLVDMRRRIADINMSHDNLDYQLTLAERLADSGQFQQAIDLLAKLLNNHKSGDRLFSIITSTMSFHYGQMGDKDHQMQYLIKSAESDLEGCIRENTSLRAIADRLFDEGDIDRAYRYMRVAVDDANFYGTRLRNIQASHIVPKILNAYQTKQERNHRNMRWLLAAISLIALMLVVGVVAIYQLFKRYRRLNEQKKAINEQLRQVNVQLEDTIGQLHETNSQLQEREKLSSWSRPARPALAPAWRDSSKRARLR